MGVFPVFTSTGWRACGLPHARGGVSQGKVHGVQHVPSSPRPWGCFYFLKGMAVADIVFPTPVGVFLGRACKAAWQGRLPHARGGVSRQDSVAAYLHQSSPRPWGCFCRDTPGHARTCVFPTPVGVFPFKDKMQPCLLSLPHARGGVSLPGYFRHNYGPSSPRPWGCFLRLRGVPCPDTVFPTPVGVFPKSGKRRADPACLPHARGGVSIAKQLKDAMTRSSPRPWGCFSRRPARPLLRRVFPTPVGVFLFSRLIFWFIPRLPHARGGVSKSLSRTGALRLSSPRPWGCF